MDKYDPRKSQDFRGTPVRLKINFVGFPKSPQDLLGSIQLRQVKLHAISGSNNCDPGLVG
jgi:hypothetical protein